MPLKIERLGHLGDGVAEGPVFVTRTLPGEVVEGEIQGNELANPRILQPSPKRVSPSCRHYKSCGGCSLQHASDDFVAEWKSAVVKDALAARGLEAKIRAIHTSPPFSRRRATLTARRTKKGATVGFHRSASDVIVDVPDCRILVPQIREALSDLAQITSISASRKDQIRLSVTSSENGIDLQILGGKHLTLALRQELIAIADVAGFSRVTWEGEEIATFRLPILQLGRTRVVPPPGAFLQATKAGEAALQSAVLEVVEAGEGPVVDLFSGLGTFALPLSQFRDVHAVEGDQALLDALDHAWRHGNKLRRVSTERRDLFRHPLTADELATYSVAVIDPPRAGAEAQTRALSVSGVARIAFVSCNPVTFARDAQILTDAGYRLDWLDVVDQFRWSPHVELVAQFSLD